MTVPSTAAAPGLRLVAAGMLAFAISGCAMFGAGGGGGLAPGLTARMDASGANLDRAQALGLINQYRAVTGAGALAADAGLDATAQQLAAQYAGTGTAPGSPEGVVAIRLSAGYFTFAETFSGWRNSPADAEVLAARPASRAGLGVAYSANSNYGVYWVLLLDD